MLTYSNLFNNMEISNNKKERTLSLVDRKIKQNRKKTKTLSLS